MVFCLHFKKQSDWDSTATYLNACFLWAAGKIPCALYKGLLFWLLQLYQLQILYTQSQIQPDTRADHTQTLQNWFSFTGCEHTIKSSSRWHHFFFFSVFKKRDKRTLCNYIIQMFSIEVITVGRQKYFSVQVFLRVFILPVWIFLQ